MRKYLILKSHFLFLGIILISSTIEMFWRIGFVNWLDKSLKTAISISGIWSFINYLTPFRRVSYYLLIYPLSLLLVATAFIFRGIVGAAIISIVLIPFNLNQTHYHQDKIKIYDNAEGFMSMCCSYRTTEVKLLFFEKDLGTFENEGMIDFEKVRVRRLADGIQIVFSEEYFDYNDNSYKMKEKEIVLN